MPGLPAATDTGGSGHVCPLDVSARIVVRVIEVDLRAVIDRSFGRPVTTRHVGRTRCHVFPLVIDRPGPRATHRERLSSSGVGDGVDRSRRAPRHAGLQGLGLGVHGYRFRWRGNGHLLALPSPRPVKRAGTVRGVDPSVPGLERWSGPDGGFASSVRTRRLPPLAAWRAGWGHVRAGFAPAGACSPFLWQNDGRLVPPVTQEVG
jgi:hypothetical protein